MSGWSATPSPKLGLLAPGTATITSGAAATTVTITPSGGRPVAAWRIKRLASSAGTLHFNTAATADGTGDYQLTSADHDSGWIWSQDASVSVYASGGDVVYELWRLQG